MPSGIYPGNVKDLQGKRFGRLVVLSEERIRDAWWNVRWLCQCDCGNRTIVSSRALQGSKFRRTQSCGCLRREKNKKQFTMRGL